MPGTMTSWKRNYSVLTRTVLIFIMTGIVQTAPMPNSASTSAAATASSPSASTFLPTTLLRSSSSQDGGNEFDMHLPTRPNFQRILSHRSNDALKNLFENSRTTEETSRPPASAAATSANRIPETETIATRTESGDVADERGPERIENFNDHYLETTTARQSSTDDIGTTQYIRTPATSSSTSGALLSNSEDVDSQTTTYFIVKTTLPPPHHIKYSSTEVPSKREESQKDATYTTLAAETMMTTFQNDATARTIGFEYDSTLKNTNTPMSLLSLNSDVYRTSTTSPEESQKIINLSDGEKIDSNSMTPKTTMMATTVVGGTSGMENASPVQLTGLLSAPFSASTTTTSQSTTLQEQGPTIHFAKHKGKINKGMGSKGTGSISKKKSGITTMGHDGVKVTRKKQLLEKSYRDDVDIVPATSGTVATVIPSIPATRSETVAIEKSRKVMEPMMAVEVSYTSSSTAAAPVTIPKSIEMISEGSGIDGKDSTTVTTSSQIPTEKSTKTKPTEMETENKLWNDDDARKNYFEATSTTASMGKPLQSTFVPETSSITSTDVNLDDSKATAAISSEYSPNPQSTDENNLDLQATVIDTEITAENVPASESSTSPFPSHPITTAPIQNNASSNVAPSVKLSISSISSSAAELSITTSTVTKATSAAPLSATSSRPKPNFLNETDILVVEITSADNSTDDVVSNEDSAYNGNSIPKFTIHNDGISEYDSGNTRPYGTGLEIDYESSKSQSDDDLFVPDLKLEPIGEMPSVTISTKERNPVNQRETVDRDSDTIFYISNTEVKVIESKPTQNSNAADKLSNDFGSVYDSRHSGSDPQYYPAIYEEDVIIDFPAKNVTYGVAPNQIGTANKDDQALSKSERYEEDIILSPMKNNFDPLKIIANRNNDGSEPKQIRDSSDAITVNRHSNPLSLENNPSLTYIGEKLIEVEPSQTDSPITFPEPNPNNSEAPLEVNESLVPISDVIIQPAIIPEMSIGVPVIGELPPQIELKEIDFLADAPITGMGASVGNSGIPGNTNDPNNERFGSIQYGGDLFARDATVLTKGSGYDMDTEYVFGGRQHSYNSANGFNSVNGVVKVNRDKNRDNGRYSGAGYDGNNDVTVASRIFMHAVNNLQKDQLVAEVRSGAKEASVRPSSGNGTGPGENLTNATAYSVMEDTDGDLFNFTDMQTLFLACFATVMPLILCVLLAFGLRYLWRKYRPGPSVSGLIGDASTDPLAAKSMTMSQDELKSTDSGFAINRSNDTLESNGTEIDTKSDDRTRLAYRNTVVNSEAHDLTPNGMITTSSSNHSGANGSVITMTLKNNHLIVETEERNDISRDARETKMHYTPSEKDGVFVVEVARGADSTGAPGSPRNNAESRPANHTLDIENLEKTSTTDAKEEVQIHQPPRSGENNDISTIVEIENNKDNSITTSLKSDPEPPATNLASSNTGLSQSDLSTSSGDSNKGYTYGNQQLYTVETKGYQPSSPKLDNVPVRVSPIKCEDDEADTPNENGTSEARRRPDPDTKPIITAALLKQDTINEMNDICSNQEQKSRSINESSHKYRTEIIVTNNVHNADTKTNINDDEKSLPSINSNDTNDSRPQDNQQHNHVENGGITPVINNDNGHKDETPIPEAIHENGTANGQTEHDMVVVDANDVENGFDSIISLPPPPPTSDEIKQLNDVILAESNQLDSLPPPPPPVDSQTQIILHETTNGHSEGQNGVAIVPVVITGAS